MTKTILTDHAKNALALAIDGTRQMLGPGAQPVLMKMGPAKIVEFIIRNTKIPQAATALQENREEAERHIAGLLGMM